jgi:hypothetical protein
VRKKGREKKKGEQCLRKHEKKTINDRRSDYLTAQSFIPFCVELSPSLFPETFLVMKTLKWHERVLFKV